MKEKVFMQEINFPKNPFEAFQQWFDEAKSNPKITDATALNLATSSKNGRPSSRMVLLKQFSENGFIFFTNENSQKGRNLHANPQAEMCFYWEPLGRQVRIYGKIEEVLQEKSDEYFYSRHPHSQIASSISNQSSVLESYESLKNQFQNLIAQDFKPVRPPHWKGFCLKPLEFEFWIDGSYRLHTRHKFKLVESQWQHSFLYP